MKSYSAYAASVFGGIYGGNGWSNANNRNYSKQTTWEKLGWPTVGVFAISASRINFCHATVYFPSPVPTQILLAIINHNCYHTWPWRKNLSIYILKEALIGIIQRDACDTLPSRYDEFCSWPWQKNLSRYILKEPPIRIIQRDACDKLPSRYDEFCLCIFQVLSPLKFFWQWSITIATIHGHDRRTYQFTSLKERWYVSCNTMHAIHYQVASPMARSHPNALSK